MPILIDRNKVMPPETQAFVDPDKEAVGLGEQIGGAVQIDNLGFNLYQLLAEGRTDFEDPNFDVTEHLTDEELADDSYLYVTSQKQLEEKRMRAKRESKARQAVREGPLNEFLATGIAVMTDPTSYIPFFGQAGKGRTAVSTATRIASRAAAENVVQEAMLYGIQEDRRASEMLMAGIFGGALGFGAGMVGSALGRAGRQADIDSAIDFVQAHVDDSVGAARLSNLASSAPDTLAVGQRVLRPVAQALRRVGLAAPSLELGTSTNPIVRDYVHRLFDTGIMTAGEKGGRAFGSGSALDIKIRGERDALQHFLFTTTKRGYTAAKKDLPGMRWDQFSREVTRALRNGDVSTNPHVQKVARELRAEILEPYKKDLIDLGFFKDTGEVVGAKSYAPRVIDKTARVGAKSQEFAEVVAADMRAKVEPDFLDKLRRDGMTDADIDDMFKDQAREFLDRQGKSQRGRIANLHVIERGPLKGRTWDIDDNLIEEFLDNDVLRLLGRYTNTVVTDANLRRAGFDKLDAPHEVFTRMDEDLGARIDAEIERVGGDKAKADKAIERLQRQDQRERDVMQALWDRLRGMDGITDDGNLGVAALQAARTYTYMSSLGSVTISSTPDPFRAIMTEGIARTSGKLIGDLMTGLKGVRMAMKTNRHLGNGLDLVNNQRAGYLFETAVPDNTAGRLNQGLSKASNIFSWLTFLPHWNTFWKGVTSFVVQNRIMDVGEALAAGKKVSARDMTRLAQSRLTPEDAIEIYNHFSKGQEKVNGSWVLDIPNIPKSRLGKKFAAAVNRDVDNTIITPGTADAPIWTGTEWGKSMFQFKKFGSSATQRIMIAGLQAGLSQRDISVLLGATLMAGMGAASVQIKEAIRGKEPKKRTPAAWVAEGIDRSGLLGMYFDMEGIAGAVTAGTTPTSLLTGQEPSRYAGRNFLGRVMGPSAGKLQEAQQFTAYGIDHLRDHGTMTQSDLHRGMRLVPYTGLFYMQPLMRKLEEQTHDTFDLPERVN